MSVDLSTPAPRTAKAKDTISKTLEMDIIFGHIAPGDRLIEDELMERFSGSRHAIRAAIDTVVKRGLAKREPNKGAHACRYSHTQITQMYELRNILQDAAITSIRFPVDPTVITALSILNDAHGTACKRGDLEAMFHLNEQFHRTVFACCDNKELCAAIEAESRKTQPIRTNSFKVSGYLALARKEHRQIIDALVASDHAALLMLSRAHIDRPMRDYIKRYQLVE
ncbi:GntR family transcriptional regulator [Sulfitobacter sp. HNIBRBA2951]|uniref:GntR family transcriptional regulator n=1 Tax=Sulfitobacter aquimarinus TaxID=3158557 RepID=UPI0032E00225